jgi:60 kDa SS-A/Ro ribonucleoprotein
VFALAMVFSCGDPAAVQAAKAAFARVVRTTDHLSMFFGYAKQLRGKAAGQGTSLVTGRALRSALASCGLLPRFPVGADRIAEVVPRHAADH